MTKIEVYTIFGDANKLAKRKRKKWSGWKFLVKGEWSQSPYHGGDHTFYVACTEDKCAWAIMRRGFPKKIVAVLCSEAPQEAAVTVPLMMTKMANDGGYYIEFVEEYGSIADEIPDLYLPDNS